MNRPPFPVWCTILPLFATSASLRAQDPTPPPVEPPPPAPATEPTERLQWRWGETTLKFGGFIKVDLIHDFDAIGSADSFDPRTIPTPEEPGENTLLQAKSTRLNVDVRGPTSAGAARAFVEGDFFDADGSFRLRHAYGTLGPVLAGQTWSTFMDEDAMPETLDFESPIGFPQIRQTQVRYTNEFGGGSYAAVSLEDPASEVIAPTGVPGEVEEPLPDLNARVRWKNDRGHVQLGAFVGMASFRPTGGDADDVMLWGFNLATKLLTFGPDSAYVQLTYGDGVGRYRGGITAAPDADGELEAVETTAVLLGYEHHWNETYRSTVSYSWADGDIPDGAPPDSTEAVQYLAVNFIWQFADRAWTGIEYLYGTRDTTDGLSAEANRVQMSIRFDL